MPAPNSIAAARAAALKSREFNIYAALEVLFPGIDPDDVEIVNEDGVPRIVRWHRPEPQPTEARLRAVVIPKPNLTLTARQARLWLLRAGLDDGAVRMQIEAISDATQRAAALIEWEYSVEIHLNHPLVQIIGSSLGLSAETLRHAFETAKAL